MPRPVHHTKSASAWEHDILPLLPPDLDALAVATGAYHRHRAFACAADLVRGLLAYALTSSSLRHLGAWATIQQVATLAPSAWFERLRAAGPFLQALVTHRLGQSRPRWLSQVVAVGCCSSMPRPSVSPTAAAMRPACMWRMT